MYGGSVTFSQQPPLYSVYLPVNANASSGSRCCVSLGSLQIRFYVHAGFRTDLFLEPIVTAVNYDVSCRFYIIK